MSRLPNAQWRHDGYAAEDKSPPPLHWPLFYPEYSASLVTGISTLSAAVLELPGHETV